MNVEFSDSNGVVAVESERLSPQSYHEFPSAADAAARFAAQLFEQQPYQSERPSEDSKNSKVLNLVMQVCPFTY
jgi:hypothetical protein